MLKGSLQKVKASRDEASTHSVILFPWNHAHSRGGALLVIVTGMLLEDIGEDLRTGFYMTVTAWQSPGLAGCRSRFRSSLDAACSLDVVLESPSQDTVPGKQK